MSSVQEQAPTIAPHDTPQDKPSHRRPLSPAALRRAEDEAYLLHAVEMLPVRTIASRQQCSHPAVVRRIQRAATRAAQRDAEHLHAERLTHARRYESLLASAVEDYQQERTIARLKAVRSILQDMTRLHGLLQLPPPDLHLHQHATIAPSPQAAHSLLGRDLIPLPQPSSPPALTSTPVSDTPPHPEHQDG